MNRLSSQTVARWWGTALRGTLPANGDNVHAP
ncbi:hypothetical protein BW23_6011 [Burkholderia ubonensis MSMB22]|nr:hypothetical protein BW23_6011 [Burkholderia ubonensis MSMB22]